MGECNTKAGDNGETSLAIPPQGSGLPAQNQGKQGVYLPEKKLGDYMLEGTDKIVNAINSKQDKDIDKHKFDEAISKDKWNRIFWASCVIGLIALGFCFLGNDKQADSAWKILYSLGIAYGGAGINKHINRKD